MAISSSTCVPVYRWQERGICAELPIENVQLRIRAYETTGHIARGASEMPGAPDWCDIKSGRTSDQSPARV